MDIITHAASGAAAGLVLGLIRRKGEYPDRRLTIAACTAGSVLPDIDAISHGFGAWGRKIYYGHHWYSHHQLSHSLLGCAVLAALAALLWSLLSKRRERLREKAPPATVAALLFAGSAVHLLGDLPTPPGSFDGIPLLFPLSGRFGGWSLVWWWHNYYVTFVLLTALVAAALLGIVEYIRPRFRPWSRRLQAAASLLAFLLAVNYFAHCRFRDSGNWYENDKKALEAQKKWVPEPFYGAFVKASELLPFEF